MQLDKPKVMIERYHSRDISSLLESNVLSAQQTLFKLEDRGKMNRMRMIQTVILPIRGRELAKR